MRATATRRGRPNRLPKDVPRSQIAQRARSRYEGGASIREIATALGCSYGLARELLLEAGVQVRARGGASRRTRPLSGHERVELVASMLARFGTARAAVSDDMVCAAIITAWETDVRVSFQCGKDYARHARPTG